MSSRVTSGLFLKEIDWSNPRFVKWDLSQIEKLNDEQRDALTNADYVIKYVNFCSKN